MPLPEPRRILIVKLSSIGDVLMATPVARALRESFPKAHITWIVERKSAEVVVGNPYLSETIVWERERTRGWARGVARFAGQSSDLRRRFREAPYDVALDLQGLLRGAVVAAISGAPVRLGARGARELAPLLYTHRVPLSPDSCVQQRWLDLLAPLGVRSRDTRMTLPLSEEERAFARRFFYERSLDPALTVAFVPASANATKQWVSERWSALADRLWEGFGVRPLILGGTADVALAREVGGHTTAPAVLAAGQTTLKQAAALLEQCRAVVGVDTGLLHFSVALERPTVGLFSPRHCRALAKFPHFRWLAKEPPAALLNGDPDHHTQEGMRCITVDEVLDALLPWLRNHPSPLEAPSPPSVGPAQR